MAVITLAREVGSGGHTIAQLLAERLGYRVVGRRELVSEAARRGMRLPAAFAEFADEQRLGRPGTSPLYFSVGELEYGDALRGATPEAVRQTDSFLETMAHERRVLLLRIAAITYELVAQDRLILIGAGGQFLLAGLPGVLRAKVVAPTDVRAERLAAAYELDLAAAKRAVVRGDGEQIDYNRAVYDADWHDSLHWDLTVNSERLSPKAVCEVILAALNASHGELNFATATAKSLDAAAAINRAFAERAFGQAWPFAMPSVDGVVLQGDAATAEDAADVLDVARRAGGRARVIDRLVVARTIDG